MAHTRADTPSSTSPDTSPGTDGSGFAELGVPAPLVKALVAQGITSPFPIQTATLPDSLAGRDVLGRGRTGSGKTYAFVVPLLARLAAGSGRRAPNRPRALVLAPTRELASQIEAAMAPLAAALGMRTVTIFGGVKPGGQISALRNGVDVVIACPGRLEDHVRTGHADLSAVQLTVLDEADHMADLGFLPGVRRLMEKTDPKGQRLLFSATLDRGVDVLVKRFLTNPVTHSVDSEQSPVSTMTHHVLHVSKDDRLPVVADLAAAPGRTLVFTRTKHGARNLARQLNQRGVPAVELHGNLSQNARTRNLDAFSAGTAPTMVATDIAARGIHVDGIGLVVHADPPVEHKAYLHRSGRTARAGTSGTVVTMMTDAQVSDVRDLTRKAGIKPTTTRIAPGHALLGEIAPGERTYVAASEIATTVPPGSGRGGSGGAGGGRGGQGGGQGGRGRRPAGGKPGARSGGQGGGGASGQQRGGPKRSRNGAGAGSGNRTHSAASFSSNRGR